MSPPKHRVIHAELLDRITSGVWPPGAAIPHEEELAREFSVTRPTVARAMADLVNEGLIERRRRAGSRVVERRPVETVLRIPKVRAEIEAGGRTYGYRLLDREVVPAASPGDARSLRLRCLHTADGWPFQLEDRAIELATVPAAEREGFATEGPNEWLIDQVPFTRAEQELTAEAATSEEARLLDIPEASPVFVITRRTWSGASPVTRVRLVHPGAGFRLLAHDRAATSA
jgi:GntR family histidine utilization transcriptional repressor